MVTNHQPPAMSRAGLCSFALPFGGCRRQIEPGCGAAIVGIPEYSPATNRNHWTHSSINIENNQIINQPFHLLMFGSQDTCFTMVIFGWKIGVHTSFKETWPFCSISKNSAKCFIRSRPLDRWQSLFCTDPGDCNGPAYMLDTSSHYCYEFFQPQPEVPRICFQYIFYPLGFDLDIF